MFIKILFWLIIACDVGALGLFFVLGLAAGPSSKTSPLAIAAFMLIVPGLLLLGAILVSVLAKSAVWRGLALLAAASPILFVVISSTYSGYDLGQYKDAKGSFASYKPGPMREVEEAIVRNDAAAVAVAARSANLKQESRDGSTVLVVALRQLAKTPGPPDVLRALLQAGADPNAAQMELPLYVAI